MRGIFLHIPYAWTQVPSPNTIDKALEGSTTQLSFVANSSDTKQWLALLSTISFNLVSPTLPYSFIVWGLSIPFNDNYDNCRCCREGDHSHLVVNPRSLLLLQTNLLLHFLPWLGEFLVDIDGSVRISNHIKNFCWNLEIQFDLL